jgi:DNA phosphorothioation-associated putative methyltransferase
VIPRHRTALSRAGLSRPVRLALDDGVLASGATFFDYGCGRGTDVAIVSARGITAEGWDPVHAPDRPRHLADVVNLGFVVNVIEDEAERREALRAAWELTKGVLVVTARMRFEELGQALTPYRDGYLTSRGTFQKFYDHGELRTWVAQSVGVDPVAAAPGTFYVFRDSAARESFLASRQRRTGPSLRPSSAELVFDRHRQLFDEILPFFSARGRLPAVHEVAAIGQLLEAVPRVDTLLRAIRTAVGSEAFDKVVSERQQDLLVYLALAKFDKRPSIQRLPLDIQLDVRSLFPSYAVACERADQLLLQVGDRCSREAAFQEATVGKLTGNALYVHVSSVHRLPVLLRLYEGCARAFVGAVEGTTLVKLHRMKHQVSYLSYPRFDQDAHPVLVGSLVVRLRDLVVDYRDYSTWTDPPLLHRKELFVAEDYPKRALFAGLTAREERLGLLTEPSTIGTLSGWQFRVRSAGVTITGHRVRRLEPPGGTDG